jgi:cytochrome d ubiquinol oxidase subunit II
LFLLLLALIVRGIAFEFRSKDASRRWRKFWDWAIFFGSAVPAVLMGVAFGNLVHGVPIDAEMNYAGTFFTLLNPYALLAGAAALLAFSLHGAIFLSLKTSAEMQERARRAAQRLWLPTVAALLALLVATYFATDILSRLGVNPGVVPLSGVAAILLAGYFLRRQRDGWAFAMTVVAIAVAVITAFMILFPRVMVSSLDPAYSLTIYNASSSHYTLRVMSIVAVVFVPIVLAYQAWSYWVFRKRLSPELNLEY